VLLGQVHARIDATRQAQITGPSGDLRVSDTFDHLARSSKLVFGFTDDCVLERQGRDDDFSRLSSRMRMMSCS